MPDLPDVREGDVWADGYYADDHRTVLVVRVCLRLCVNAAVSTGAVRATAEDPHAHVVASPSGRRTVVAIRRFKPGRRGYRLINRKGADDA